jgi:hypothetical protein
VTASQRSLSRRFWWRTKLHGSMPPHSPDHSPAEIFLFLELKVIVKNMSV